MKKLLLALFLCLVVFVWPTSSYDIKLQAPKASQPNANLVLYYSSYEKDGSKREVFDIPRQSFGTIRCLQLLCVKRNVTFESGLSDAYYAVDCGGRGYVIGVLAGISTIDTFAEIAALSNFTVCTSSCTTTGINATVDPYLITLMANHTETCEDLAADPTYYTLSDDCGINTSGSTQDCYQSDGTTPNGAPACNETCPCNPASIVPNTCWFYVCYAATDLGAIVSDCSGNTFLYWYNNDTNVADDMLQRYGLLPCEELVYCDNSSLINMPSAAAAVGNTPYNNNGTWSTFGFKLCNSNGIILDQVGNWTFYVNGEGTPELIFPLVEQCGCSPQVNGSSAPSPPPLSMTTLNPAPIGEDDPRDTTAFGLIAGVIGGCCCCIFLFILLFNIFRFRRKEKE